MLKQLKTVTIFFLYIIRRFFITNSYINNILQIIQQTVAVVDEKLHYINKKNVTLKRKAPVLPIKKGETRLIENCNDETYKSLLLTVDYVENGGKSYESD